MNFNQKIGLNKTKVSVAKKNLVLKLLLITISGLILIVGSTYSIAFFYKSTGSFTINLNRYDMIKTGISISETADFARPTTRLSAPAIENVTNISAHDLPNDLQDKDGSYGDKLFISYTYYVKNSGETTVSYKSALDIEKVTFGVDSAIRMRVYDNGQYTDYAKLKNDGSGPEKETTPFLSNITVMEVVKSQFAPGDTHKYTVVIWLEGDDPECVDDIIGGMLKTVMNISVVEGS